MILHLLSDPDFNNLIINNFEIVNFKKNIYIVFNKKQYDEIINNNSEIKVILIDTNNIKQELDFSSVKSIVVHCLSFSSAQVVLLTPDHIPVFWSIFGVDLYNFHPSLQKKIYGPLTKDYIYSKNPLIKILFTLKIYYNFYFKSNNVIQRKAIRKVRFYSTVIPSETLYTKNILSPNSNFVKLDVGHLYFVKKENLLVNLEFKKDINSIYIGNSASPTSNHLEVIDIIKNKDCINCQVSLQLSYGSYAAYSNYIKNVFLKELKCNLNVIENWMEKKEFIDLIRSQSVFLFNSIRQQGVGAIIMAIWYGAKVYLNEGSSVLFYYKSLGLKIYSIQEDFSKQSISELFQPLSINEIIMNRKILLKEYSSEKVEERTKKVVSELNNYVFK